MALNFMKIDRMWFGPITLLLFCLGTLMFSLLVPGYSHIQQTVSEIGEIGSPARIPFTLLLCAIGICLILFASAIREVSSHLGFSNLVAYLIVCMGLSVSGVGIFAFPHPLHNVFGMSEIIGYQAPIALAITWRRHPALMGIIAWSWILYVAIVIAMVINLSPLFSMPLWSFIKPIHGLAQRFLFLSFFIWCAFVGFKLHIWKKQLGNHSKT
ncbi:MAG TPA: DUF998 domain-containing protein [Cyclobacteriaceae bacterium]